MKFGEDLVPRVESALRHILADVPFVRSVRTRRPRAAQSGSADLSVTLVLPDGQVTLQVAVKSKGEPRLARDAVNLLARYRDLVPGSYGVFAAPYVSSASARLCSDDGIGYLDLAGNCRLAFGTVLITREGKANPFGERRTLRSLFSPRAERVLRVLLDFPGRRWKTQTLAGEAGVSLGQVSNVRRLLADREWVRTEPAGLVLDDPSGLLTEWARNYRTERNVVRAFYAMKSVPEMEQQLGALCQEQGLQYALTGFSAAARWAPVVTYSRVSAYVSGDIEGVVRGLGLKEVPTGANLSLLRPYDEGVFHGQRSVDGVRLVSPVQAYLDLSCVKGRGEEAASALLEKEIRPRW
jgi:hypothetical protein